MPQDHTIRPLVVGQDRAPLADFHADPGMQRLEFLPRAIAAGDAFALVAEIEGRAIGWAVVHLRYRDDIGWEPDNDALGFQSGVNGYLEYLEVAPAHRNRGIGARLLAAVEAEALRHGKSILWLHTGEENAGAQRFYEREGWAHVSTVYPVWRSGRATRVYSKELRSG